MVPGIIRMNIVLQETAQPSTRWPGHLKQGRYLRLTATTIVDFVAFSACPDLASPTGGRSATATIYGS